MLGFMEINEHTRIDIHGTGQDTVITTCHYGPRNIALTREEEDLIFSHIESRTVNMVRHGESETSSPHQFTGHRVVCTVQDLWAFL